MGLLMLVSFTCHQCTAVLSIPEEQSGISGPCPYCGEVVTSPVRQAGVQSLPPPVREPVPVRSVRQKPEVGVNLARMARNGEKIVRPVRPLFVGLKVAAGLAVLGGGVLGTVNLWKPDARVPEKKTSPEIPLVRNVPGPRPAVLVSAMENLPPPSDHIPAPVAAPAAVARNVSTAPAPTVSVVVPPEEPGLFPVHTPEPKVTRIASMSVEEKEIRRVVPTGGPLAAPGSAIIRFFAAPNWQERLKYCLAPQKVKPLMESYYKVHQDGPIVPEDIEITRMMPVEGDPGRHYFAFMVYFPGRAEGVPLSVEETKTGCVIEWCSFVEGKDQVLAKFFSEWRKEPGTFRVTIRRGHYFETDVPAQERKVVFDVTPPDRSQTFKLWVDKDSEVWRKDLDGEKFGWNIIAMMVLTLQWEKTADGVKYVRLVKVAGDSWHPELVE